MEAWKEEDGEWLSYLQQLTFLFLSGKYKILVILFLFLWKELWVIVSFVINSVFVSFFFCWEMEFSKGNVREGIFDISYPYPNLT